MQKSKPASNKKRDRIRRTEVKERMFSLALQEVTSKICFPPASESEFLSNGLGVSFVAHLRKKYMKPCITLVKPFSARTPS